MQPIPYPNNAPDEILQRSASWSQRYSCLKVWTDGRTQGRTHGRRLESHTIAKPGASGSGEPKSILGQAVKFLTRRQCTCAALSVFFAVASFL